MIPILIGALIELAGFVFFIVGGTQHGFPPGPAWLVPAIVLVVVGNGLVVYTVLSRARANKSEKK